MKFKFISLLFILSIILVGCTTDKSKIKLATSKDVLKYVKKNYGEATITNEIVGTENASYVLEDKKDKFTYECHDYIQQFCIDATCSGFYSHKLQCDFEKEYRKYIIEKLDLKNIIDSYSPNSNLLLKLHYPDEKSAINDKKRVIEKIKKVDKRKFFLNYNIKIYDDEENYLGIYNIKTGKYINKYEEKIDQMTYSFAVIVHKTTSDLSGIKYLYYKKIQYKDVERLKMEWLSNSSLKEDDWTAAYYFKYEGRVYFILPDEVYFKEAEGFEGDYHSGKYNSYWFK